MFEAQLKAIKEIAARHQGVEDAYFDLTCDPIIPGSYTKLPNYLKLEYMDQVYVEENCLYGVGLLRYVPQLQAWIDGITDLVMTVIHRGTDITPKTKYHYIVREDGTIEERGISMDDVSDTHLETIVPLLKKSLKSFTRHHDT